jgi:hypothetical protein
MQTRHFKAGIDPVFLGGRPARPGTASQEENDMSFIKTALGSAAISMALLSGASAQNPEPWDLRERMAYVVTPGGKTMTMQLNERSVSMLMRTAKRVPRGTAFIMSKGELYMVNASKMMFDRAGNPMAMGGGG